MPNMSKLRGVMAEKGYNQKDIAKALGLAESTITYKLRHGSFDLTEANKLIKILDIKNPNEVFFSENVT